MLCERTSQTEVCLVPNRPPLNQNNNVVRLRICARQHHCTEILPVTLCNTGVELGDMCMLRHCKGTIKAQRGPGVVLGLQNTLLSYTDVRNGLGNATTMLYVCYRERRRSRRSPSPDGRRRR